MFWRPATVPRPANGGCRSRPRRAGTNQIAQPVLNQLVAIDDQLLLGWEVVVDRLLRHLGLARHVAHGNLFISPLGEEAGSGVGDELSGAGLLQFTQSRVRHGASVSPGAPQD